MGAIKTAQPISHVQLENAWPPSNPGQDKRDSFLILSIEPLHVCYLGVEFKLPCLQSNHGVHSAELKPVGGHDLGKSEKT